MDQIKNTLLGVSYGALDAVIGISAIRRICRDEKNANNKKTSIKSRIIQCFILNGLLFGTSIFIFNEIILKWLFILIQFLFGSQQGVVSSTWIWLEPTLSYTFSTFWVLPLFFITRVVNALWFQDIADNAFRGRPQSFRNISKFVADTLFSLLIQALFLIQAMLVDRAPELGKLLGFCHMSLLYSLYSFEYKWFNMGWELHRRLHFIENNWPYFLGFGSPLALATYLLPNYYLSGALFSILFPLFIISANEAKPKTGICDLKIRMFSLVVWLSNRILFFLFKFNFMVRR